MDENYVECKLNVGPDGRASIGNEHRLLHITRRCTLTPHYHVAVFDGIYAAGDGERPEFYPLRPPETKDVVGVATRVAMRVAALFESPDAGSGDEEEPALGELYSASIQGRIASGPNAGQRVKTTVNLFSLGAWPG